MNVYDAAVEQKEIAEADANAKELTKELSKITPKNMEKISELIDKTVGNERTTEDQSAVIERMVLQSGNTELIDTYLDAHIKYNTDIAALIIEANSNANKLEAELSTFTPGSNIDKLEALMEKTLQSKYIGKDRLDPIEKMVTASGDKDLIDAYQKAQLKFRP